MGCDGRMGEASTTMDPERRTLLSVKLEDLTETEAIFTTLMGENVDPQVH